MPNSRKRWDVEITVPENTLNLKCSLMNNPAIVEPYKGVNMPAKSENSDFAETVKGRAVIQKDGITVEDIVRMISWKSYRDSFIGTAGKYKGMEMHEFTDMNLYGLTDANRNDTKIYVKLITPDAAGNVEVPSVHRNSY